MVVTMDVDGRSGGQHGQPSNEYKLVDWKGYDLVIRR
jgi:hypothetical protein